MDLDGIDLVETRLLTVQMVYLYQLSSKTKRKNCLMLVLGKKNKREIPAEMISTKGREVLSSTFGLNNNSTLVFNHNKYYLLSLAYTKMIHLIQIHEKKLETFNNYFLNKTKRRVNNADLMCFTYQKRAHWPMFIFFAMLKISDINSQIIYHGNSLKPTR